MDRRLEELIDAARGGAADSVPTLVSHLRRHPPEPAVLVRLGRADEEALRVAAALAMGGREEEEVLALADVLSGDERVAVRQALANAWAEFPSWGLPESAARRVLADADAKVRLTAVEVAARRADLVPRALSLIREDPAWEVRQAAARALADAPAPYVAETLLTVLALDDDSDVTGAAAESLEAHLARATGWPSEAMVPPPSILRPARERVESRGVARTPRLAAWLEDQVRTAVDLDLLRQFGTDLTAGAEAGSLPRAFGVDDVCEHVIASLSGAAPRAVLLSGDSGAGKTAVVNEVVHRLRQRDGGWRVLRIAPSDLLVGTRYLGEWETKVKELLEAVCAPRRVVLYVPNVHELAQVGVHSKSDRSVAGMLAPHLESGEIAILGETTPEAFRAGLGAHPSLRRLFRRFDLQPASETATRRIVTAVCVEAGIEAPDAVVDRVQELAAFYMPSSVDPGRTVGLLREVLERRGDVEGPLGARQVLEALSQTTGVPLDMIDDDRPLDLDGVRAFFEDRVRGQPEAVGAMVDLVSLIKAGLTDPSKPYGIYLFVGPTGVGKTELARALAELLFGDASRLHRFDMSEYATYGAFERLMGAYGRPGLLTEAVRESPFAVFLLDEIEKAHVNVFDLCLQIFDAGRLTDGRGRTSDFRRTIFVLTSNVGSVVPTESAVGFGATAPPPPDATSTLRELRHFFRPEFLGRLDQVVHFRLLGEETAEWIARREVGRVLERSGLSRRQLTVDVDPRVLSFLLRRGYSPALGARPLKRTVERFVLLPVARAVASGHVAPGSILKLEARRDDVTVRIEAPEGVGERTTPPEPSPPALEELRTRAETLGRTFDALREAERPIEERRRRLLARSREAGFWDDATGARAVLGEIHRWEALHQALEKLGHRIRDTRRHVGEASSRRQHVLRLGERLAELEREASRLGTLLASGDAEDLADAFVTLTKVKAEGRDLDGVEKLARMYLGFAARRGLDAEVLDDHRTREPREDQITLLLSGAGAVALLQGEQGLHQLVRPHAAQGGLPAGRDAHGRARRDRELVRVEVLPVPGEDEALDPKTVRITTRALQRARGRLLPRPDREITLVDARSMHAVRAWGQGSEETLAKALLPLLHARVHAAEGGKGDDALRVVVRRYELGASPLVRDRLSGRHTGRLDRVLAGDLDLVTEPEGPPAAPSDDGAP